MRHPAHLPLFFVVDEALYRFRYEVISISVVPSVCTGGRPHNLHRAAVIILLRKPVDPLLVVEVVLIRVS